MKKLQVPFNNDLEIISLYEEYADAISDVYFAPHPSLFPTARLMINNITEKEEWEQNIIELCSRMSKMHIHTYLLLNGVNEIANNQLDIIIPYIKKLQQYNLYGIIIANPLIGVVIKDEIPDIHIKLSVLSNINTVSKVQQIDKLNIFDEVCLPSYYLHEKEKLKELKKTVKLKLSIIINSACRYDCPYFGWHHMLTSSQISKDVMDNKGEKIYKKFFETTAKLNQNQLESPFLLPEELSLYDSYIDIFKLEDRTCETSELAEYIIWYANRINPLVYDECIHGSCMRHCLDVHINRS